MENVEILLASLAIAAGALVQGTLGFGLGLVAAPFLGLVDPDLVPGPLLILSVVFNLAIGWRERAVLEVRSLTWPLACQLGGTAMAIGLLGISSPRTISIVLASSILVAVGLSIAGRAVPPTRRNVGLAGWVAGVMGTTASMPGPPLALVYQHLPGERLRATLVPFFVLGLAFAILGLVGAGHMGTRDLERAAWLLPSMAIGFWTSRYTASWMRPDVLRRSVIALSTIGACVLLFRTL